MRRNIWMLVLAMMATGPVTTGCSLPPPVIISQAPGNPLAGQQKFAVLPVVYASPLRVGQKTEADYLAGKSPDDVKTWGEAKNALGAAFAAVITAQGMWDPAARFAVRPSVSFVEPGYNVGIAYAPAEVAVDVVVVDAQGHEVDHIAMRPKAVTYTVTQRFSFCGQVAGAMVVEYLRKRAQ